MALEKKGCCDTKLGARVYDYCLNELDAEERQEFEEHMYECDFCRTEVIKASRLFEAMRENGPHYQETSARVGFWRGARVGRGWAWALIRIVLVIPVSLLLWYMARPAYYDLAVIPHPEAIELRKADAGRKEALNWYRQGEYEKARLRLEEDLKNLKNQKADDYDTYYLLALCSLLQAQKSFFSIAYRFDARLVDKGIENLSKALTQAPNAFALEDAYWYLGKAYLMKGEKEKARGYFQKIVERPEENLIRKKSAGAILNRLR